jgi:hypothetical protein
VVIGDLSSAAETRDLAGQVNQIGRMDAVIHNGHLPRAIPRHNRRRPRDDSRGEHPRALHAHRVDRPPDRLIHLSSGLHHAGAGSLRDIDWTSRPWDAAQAYAESNLHVTALALTLARVWPEVSATPSIRAGSRPKWASNQIRGDPGDPSKTAAMHNT